MAAEDMSKHFTWSSLLKFVAPSIVMTVFASLYSIVDGLFVSNFAGKTAFAAVNLAMPVILILSPVGFMVGTGGSAIVAKARGEGEEERAKRCFSFLIYSLACIGVVFGAAGFFAIEPICAAMGAEGQLLEDATLYGRIAMLSMPFYMLQYAFQSFFVTAGKPNLGLGVTVFAGLSNVALDALFIAGFGWGLVGAAVATAAAEVMAAIIALAYFVRPNTSHLRLVKTRPEWRVLGRSCANGSSELMMIVSGSVVAMIYNMQLMAYIGENGVAAYGVIMYAVMVFTGVFEGYSMGSSPLMSYQYGAKNTREMAGLLRKSIRFVGFSGIAMLILAQLLARPLAQAFVGYDAALADLTVEGFRIYSGAFLLMGFSIYGSAFFTSLGNGLVSAAIAFLRTIVFECGAVLLLPLALGIDGIWMAIIVAETASVIVIAIFFVALGERYGYAARTE